MTCRQSRKKLIFFLCLFFLVFNLFLQVYLKSFITDEPVHIAAGLDYLNNREILLNPEHPPLVKLLAALLPYLTGKVALPEYTDFKCYPGVWHTIFWSIAAIRANCLHLNLLIFKVRFFAIVIALTLACLIYKTGKGLFGETVGLFALSIYCFEPTFLGHGKFVHTDVAAALFYFWYFYTLYKVYVEPSHRGFIYLSIIFGLALAIKFSLLILVPIHLLAMIVMFFKKDWERCYKILPLMVFIPWFIVSAFYFFHISRLSEGEAKLLAKWLYLPAEWAACLGYFFKYIPIYLPTAFLKGVDMVWQHNHLGHHAYLLGHYSQMGWWYYFPIALCLKESLPILVVFFLGLVYCLFKLTKDKKIVFIIFPIFYYSIFAFTSHVNIGIRHYLPVFPFLIIAGGSAMGNLFNKNLRLRLAILLLLFLAGLEAVRVFPHYVSYFNQLAGGFGQGWKKLSDSNAEWGQDMKLLANFCHKKGIKSLEVCAVNAWLLPCYDIKIKLFSPVRYNYSETLGYKEVLFLEGHKEEQIEPHHLALGTSFLTLPPDALLPGLTPKESQEIKRVLLKWRSKKPWTIVGKTIFVYKLE